MERIIFTAELNQLRTVNQFIEQTLPEDFKALYDKIVLVVEELVVNICNYAYGGKSGPAELYWWRVNLDGQPHLRLLLKDWGTPFDPFSLVAPNMSPDPMERPIGGLGIHLVKNIVSHYCYTYDQSVNAVDLFFSRP